MQAGEAARKLENRMSRLIDADALIEVLKREEKEDDEYGLTQRADGITDAIMAVMDAPTIEPQRMRGQWIPIQRGFFNKEVTQVKCDQCGNLLDLIGVNCGRGDTNFCPNCGADMRGTE